MPAEPKPLFRSEALRTRLLNFPLPPTAEAARPRLAHWAQLLASKQTAGMKETELLAIFITDVFVNLLGHTEPVGAASYTLRRETHVEVDGKFADAALGRFSTAGDKPKFIAAPEGSANSSSVHVPAFSPEGTCQNCVRPQLGCYLILNRRDRPCR